MSRAAEITHFWDGEANRYDRAFDAPGRAGRALRSRQEAVLRLLGKGPGDVLDAGMGPGRMLGELTECGWQVSGVDTSEQMVALARKRMPQAAERLVLGSIERLPFSDCSFDAVAATGVLEYVGYGDAAIAELARVLRPGGCAVVSVPNPRFMTRLVRHGVAEPAARAIKGIFPFGRPTPPRRPPPPGRRFETKLATAGLTPEPDSPLQAGRQRVYLARKAELDWNGRNGGRSPGEPAFPADYYRRIYEVEDEHWWHCGMRDITEAVLGVRVTRGGDLLDVGCGTGGFLRWAAGCGSFKRIAGVDISAEAIALARLRVPAAEFQLAPIWDLPFETASFDLVVLNDVLQHVPDADVERALQEVRRVLRADGAVLLRTNGARRARSEGDWRVYDGRALRSELERAGFHCCRLTYANVVGSLWATVRRHPPAAPSCDRHGIPPIGSRPTNAVMYQLLRAEATYLRHSRLGLPFGHTLFALATSAKIESTAGIPEAPHQRPGQQ